MCRYVIKHCVRTIISQSRFFVCLHIIVLTLSQRTKFKICTDIFSFDTYKIISLQYLYSYDHTAQMPPINIRSYCYSIVAQGQWSLCVGSSLMPQDVKPIIRSDLRVVRFDYKFVDFTWPSWEKCSLAFRKWH